MKILEAREYMTPTEKKEVFRFPVLDENYFFVATRTLRPSHQPVDLRGDYGPLILHRVVQIGGRARRQLLQNREKLLKEAPEVVGQVGIGMKGPWHKLIQHGYEPLLVATEPDSCNCEGLGTVTMNMMGGGQSYRDVKKDAAEWRAVQKDDQPRVATARFFEEDPMRGIELFPPLPDELSNIILFRPRFLGNETLNIPFYVPDENGIPVHEVTGFAKGRDDLSAHSYLQGWMFPQVKSTRVRKITVQFNSKQPIPLF